MVLIAIASGVTGAMFGHSYCKSSTYRHEIRLHWVILSGHDSKLEPSFRSFLKARYYSLIRWAPKSSLTPECLQDFGSVDETLLKGIPIGKGLVASEEYSCAKIRISNKSK
jgi:hypothetical protein